jgi:UDP-3-O-[3-hydroxymyristoyl] N-acetylglucosamine deacetylase
VPAEPGGFGPEWTLARAIRVEGQGLHSGSPCALTIGPACGGWWLGPAGGPLQPVGPALVRGTGWATRLGGPDWELSTVEHLFGALHGDGVDAAEIRFEGAEVPALDGSAAGWVALFDAAGRVPSGAPARRFVLRRPVAVAEGDRAVRATPAAGPQVVCHVDFPAPVGSGIARFSGGRAQFRKETAPARTFGLLAEAPALRSAGLARGAGLHNTIVFDAKGPIGRPLRRPDEVAQHKLLDLLGDLALLGAPILAHVEAQRPGHALAHAWRAAALAAGEIAKTAVSFR